MNETNQGCLTRLNDMLGHDWCNPYHGPFPEGVGSRTPVTGLYWCYQHSTVLQFSLKRTLRPKSPI